MAVLFRNFIFLDARLRGHDELRHSLRVRGEEFTGGEILGLLSKMFFFYAGTWFERIFHPFFCNYGIDSEQRLRRNVRLFWQVHRPDPRLPGTGSELWCLSPRREIKELLLFGRSGYRSASGRVGLGKSVGRPPEPGSRSLWRTSRDPGRWPLAGHSSSSCAAASVPRTRMSGGISGRCRWLSSFQASRCKSFSHP